MKKSHKFLLILLLFIIGSISYFSTRPVTILNDFCHSELEIIRNPFVLSHESMGTLSFINFTFTEKRFAPIFAFVTDDNSYVLKPFETLHFPPNYSFENIAQKKSFQHTSILVVNIPSEILSKISQTNKLKVVLTYSGEKPHELIVSDKQLGDWKKRIAGNRS